MGHSTWFRSSRCRLTSPRSLTGTENIPSGGSGGSTLSPVAEVSYSEDADLALRTLEADPSQARLVQALYRAIDELAVRPDSGRRRRYTHDVWRLDVVDYAILWFQDPSGEIIVEYIGPEF